MSTPLEKLDEVEVAGTAAPRRQAVLNSYSKQFGRHVRSLRRARGMTQEVLADRSTLSPDTIRRLEHGGFSPSLDTLRKVCFGFDLELASLFESFALRSRDERRELFDLISTRTPRECQLAYSTLRALFDELDAIAAERAAQSKDEHCDGEP